jgi:toxin FitB
MNYLLDTCLISELIKPKPKKSVVNWIKQIDDDSLFISVLTLGELQKGVSKLPDSKKKNSLQNWLNTELTQRFENRIISINQQIATTWGHIQGTAEQQGKKIPAIDSLLAATAITYDLTVVTRNHSDMVRTGAKIFNPWD